jgi:hypothetical protein
LESRTLTRLAVAAEGDATALGVVRALTSGVFLVSILLTNFTNLGRLPATLLRPSGFMQLLPWSLYDAVMTPRGMFAFMCATALSLLLSTVGLWTPVTTKTSALLVLFYQGLLRNLGHFNHDEILGVYYLIVLAFAPCGDGFSVDSLLRRVRPRLSQLAYGYPILLMRVLMAWVYFSSALTKLRFSGARYFDSDTLPNLAVQHSLDNLHDTQFRYAFDLLEHRAYTTPLVALVIAWELLFPLAIFSKRARWWLLGFGVVFHVSTLFLMNIFFPHLLALYLVFVDWRAVAARLKGWRERRGSHALSDRVGSG